MRSPFLTPPTKKTFNGSLFVAGIAVVLCPFFPFAAFLAMSCAFGLLAGGVKLRGF